MKLKVKMISSGCFKTINTVPVIYLNMTKEVGWCCSFPLANSWPTLWELKKAITELCDATPRIWNVPLPRWKQTKEYLP